MRKFSIKLAVPEKFRWVAQQPWGEIVAFTHRPKIVKQYQHQEGDFIPEYWQCVGGQDLTLSDLDNMLYPQPRASSWRKSLRKL